MLFESLNTTLRAQDIQLYLTEHELPNLVNCLPAPPDTIGEAFTHDIMRYIWGKAQRLDSARLAQAKRDAIWDLDTVRVIYSEPFGYAPHELFVHVVDLDEKRIVLSKNITDLVDEPEGICLKDGYAWVVFNTGDGPRHSRLWRFSLE